MSQWQRCQEASTYIQSVVPDFKPDLAIVLGSGLGGFGREIEIEHVFPYEEIPHFKTTTVEGHSGNLILGRVEGRQVVCQQGRYHFYEGHAIRDVVFPVRLMNHLGAGSLLVTNAAGGINPEFGVGDIMLITDHINFQGTNPLIGANEDALGPRFPDMSYAYHPVLANSLRQIATGHGIALREGVYLAVSGPSYETPAEIRMFRRLGADAVGMSTVPEVIAANHLGMRVLGLSCISNAAAGMEEGPLDHSDVEKAIGQMSNTFQTLVQSWIREFFHV